PSAVAYAEADLRLVLASCRQTRGFEHALEHELAPRALRARVALERAREIDRILADALVELLQVLDFLREHAAVALIVRVGLADRLAELPELHLQRIEQPAELLRALLAQVLRLVVEDRRREILERVAQALLGLVEQRELLAGGLHLLARRRFERRVARRKILE